jgi:hypothetical protein
MPLREPPGGYVFFGTAHGTLLFPKLTTHSSDVYH